MTAIHDLHTHSNASDGALSPEALIKRAKDEGVTTLALTDHDTVAALPAARNAAARHQLNLVNGIELSAKWQQQSVHIVGLNINPESTALQEAITDLEKIRESRAISIGDKLHKAGIKHAYENARHIAGDGIVTRQHFSQFLINAGYARDQKDVFKRFLVRNKPGYVSVEWPQLDDTIERIVSAGGVAVIAHPLRYKITATKLRKLIIDFKAMGGHAIEVVTGNNDHNEINTVAGYARQYGLAASTGSDFHNDNSPWLQLGKLAPLPSNLTPVWELW